MNLITNKSYQQLLHTILGEIERHRVKAVKDLNTTQMQLYFAIGRAIVQKQQQEGWGKAVVETLADDLQKAAAIKQGFSVQNLWYMRQFYNAYQHSKKLQALAFRVPWSQNILIFSKIKDEKQRRFYLEKTMEAGWGRDVLLNQIKIKAYQKQKGAKAHNFRKALPVHLSAQAHEMLKNEYTLSFLGINEPLLERQLEDRLVMQIKDFILELGAGFAYIGNQHKLRLRSKEYAVDLLFYQRKLKCLVAIDLKIGAFEPEFAGKMNFYLNLLNKQMRMLDENPSIGIILCAEKDQVVVEYALAGMNNPIGVAEYSYQKKLPARLKGELPGVEALKAKIALAIRRSAKNDRARGA